MSDPPSRGDNGSGTAGPALGANAEGNGVRHAGEGVPRWVVMFAAAAATVLVLLLLVMLLLGGEHGPARHLPSAGNGALAPAAARTGHSVGLASLRTVGPAAPARLNCPSDDVDGVRLVGVGRC